MKRFLTCLFATCMVICFAVGLTACGNNSGGPSISGGGGQCQHQIIYYKGYSGGCDNQGQISYWHCEGVCQKFFADESLQTEISSEQINTGYNHVGATHYEAKTASCAQIGNIEYLYCPTCRTYRDVNNNCIDIVNNPLQTILAHTFENGVCTECKSLEPSQGLEINSDGMVCGIGDCTDTFIIIPNSYEKDGKIFPVTGIAGYAFDGANDGVDITGVVINKGVGRIKRNAFYNLKNLHTVTIAGAIEFEEYAFYNCYNIQSIELGEGITQLADAGSDNKLNVFSSCSFNLNNIDLPNTFNSSYLGGLTTMSIVGASTYGGAKYLGNVNNPYLFLYKAVSLDDPITEIHPDCKIIGDQAFLDEFSTYNITCEIPESVKIIGERAFHSANFVSDDNTINISKNVEYIGDAAFGGYNYAFNVDAQNANYKAVDNSLLTKDGKKLIAACPFDTNGAIKPVYVVPAGVEEIPNHTFYDCALLEGIVLPDGLIKIGSYSFTESNNLKTVNIPSSVTSLGYGVFGLEPIIFVENSEYEFNDWRNVWKNNEWVLNEKVIFNCNSNDVAEDGNVYVITDNFIYTLKDEKAAICDFGSIAITESSVVLPETLTYKNASYPVISVNSNIILQLTCSALTIPDSYLEITDIYDQFEQVVNIYNENITQLTLGTGLDAIPYFLFDLESFNYTGTVESWLNKEFVENNQRAFLNENTRIYFKQGDNFVELTSVTIPSGCTYNGQFGDSNSITEVIVEYGATIQSFGGWYDSKYTAFADEFTIKFECFEDEVSISMPSKATVYYAFGAESGSTDTFEYMVVGGKVRITAYKGSSANVVIPQNIDGKDVVDFGTVFANNTTIKMVAILARVNEIKTGAFANCTNLSVVYINGYVDNIKTGAFTNLNIATNYSSTDSVEYLTTGIYFGTNEQAKESNWADKAYPTHDSYSFDDVSEILYLVDNGNKTIVRYMGSASVLTIPNDKNFTAIRSYAFMSSSLTQVVISNTITEIGAGAFENSTTLASVTISSSVYMIGADAFKGTALTSATFEDAQHWDIVNVTTFTMQAVEESILSNATSAATYLKQTVTANYMLGKGFIQ